MQSLSGSLERLINLVNLFNRFFVILKKDIYD